MGQPGQRKFKCAECGETQMIHWLERSRAARLRCCFCGSLAMDPFSEGAIEAVELESERLHVGAVGSLGIQADTSIRHGRPGVKQT